MTQIVMPSSPGFVSRRWGIMSNTQIFEAPISKVTHRLRLTGERWLGEWTLPAMGGNKSANIDIVRNWAVFFLDLDGRSNTFLASPPHYADFYGSISGSPTVDGASQTGKTVDLTGFTAGDIVKKGQWLQFADTNQLVMAMEQKTADGSGDIADLAIKPRIRTSPANGEAIEWETPTVEMIMVTDELAWSVELVKRYQFTFAAVEVF